MFLLIEFFNLFFIRINLKGEVKNMIFFMNIMLCMFMEKKINVCIKNIYCMY